MCQEFVCTYHVSAKLIAPAERYRLNRGLQDLSGLKRASFAIGASAAHLVRPGVRLGIQPLAGSPASSKSSGPQFMHDTKKVPAKSTRLAHAAILAIACTSRLMLSSNICSR
jgi:hypothetical protein